MTIFDLINSIFKCWFWFEFFWFKAVVDAKRIKIPIKGCDSWWICGIRGDNIQMTIVDIINNLLKCWIRFEFSTSKLLFILSWSKIFSQDLLFLVIRNFWRKVDWLLLPYYLTHVSILGYNVHTLSIRRRILQH